MLVLACLAGAACGDAPARDATPSAQGTPPMPEATPTPAPVRFPPPVWRAVPASTPEIQMFVDLRDGQMWALEPPEGSDLGVWIRGWTARGEAVVAVGEEKGGRSLYRGRPGEPLSHVIDVAPGEFGEPRLSPSGSHLAVPDATGLRIVDAATGGTLAVLTEFPGWSFPVWSPDGERLLVGGAIVDWRRARVTPILGRSHVWSPSGTKIASVTDGAERSDGLPELLVHDINGNIVFRLSPSRGILDFPT